MSIGEIIGLATAAAAAGAINAVAGGGTIITFPVLMLFGTSATVANATSTVALMLGTAGSIFGFRKQLEAVKPWLWRFVPVSALGGWIGSVLLTRSSEKFFAQLVPFLLLFATLLFLAQGAFRKFAGFGVKAEDSHPHHKAVWLAILFQFGVAIYGGYFGAGIGILMLASLGLIGLTHLHEMNALKTVLSSLINLVASIWFIASGLVDVPKATIMTIGALIGYYLGAHFSQQIPQNRLRYLITGIGLGISAYLFWKHFH